MVVDAVTKQMITLLASFDAVQASVGYYEFRVDGIDAFLGTAHPSIVDDLKSIEGWTVDDTLKTITLLGSDRAERDAGLMKTMLHLRSLNKYPTLSRWRDEIQLIYGPDGTAILGCERAGTNLLGTQSFGVHMTGYYYEDGELKIWVPRRAHDKSTYPGMLDNTAAGCISLAADGSAMDALEVMFKECEEETSLSRDDVENKIRLSSILSYGVVRTEPVMPGQNEADFLTQWDVTFCYDVELDAGVKPMPNDGEVAEFLTMTPDEVKAALLAGEFKPNSAIVMIDFLRRFGYVDDEEYAGVDELCHRKLLAPVSAETLELARQLGLGFWAGSEGHDPAP